MRVPLDMHESIIDNFRTRDAGGEIVKDAMLDALASAMADTRRSAEKIAALSEAISNDKTVTPQAGALKIRQHALGVSEKIASRLDQARARAAAEIETLTASTAAPPLPKDQFANAARSGNAVASSQYARR